MAPITPMEQIEPIETINQGLMNYFGSSMSPLFKSGDRLQVISCDHAKIRAGDVVVLISPEDGSKVVHRVISVDSNGIKTRGDSCNHVDDWVLRRENILGRVVAAQRGSSRRRIFGGLLGRLIAAKVRVIHAMDSGFSSLLHPVYKRLSRSGIFRRWLPSRMRPQVISLNRATGRELQLLMGRRVVGRLLPGITRWHISRPYRLFVDEKSLPENPGKASVVRGKPAP